MSCASPRTSRPVVAQAAAAKQAIGKIASLAALGRERFNAETTGWSDRWPG